MKNSNSYTKIKLNSGELSGYIYVDYNGNFILDDNYIIKINRSEKLKKILSKK
jgi:hypothetical protein